VSARSEILGLVDAALSRADRSLVHVPRAYRSRPSPLSREGLVDLFVERVEDYRATVTRGAGADASGLIRSVLAAELPSESHVVLPPDLPWEVSGGVVDSGLYATELDHLPAVVTAATVAIAETGTIVLTHGPGEGRRAITLVPDLHVCVVLADQVVPDVPDAVALLDPRRPQTWISGPSATSDIELNRVEGVHGPRSLHVVLLT